MNGFKSVITVGGSGDISEEEFQNNFADGEAGEIIFDEEPPQGIEFKNGKIYVNTKCPDLYQELH